MTPFMEGSDGVHDPISSEAREEEERCRGLRSGMVWLQDSYVAAQVEARRLLEAYGPDVTLDSVLRDPEESRRLGEVLSPRDPADPLHYRLFAVIMHHGTAYSGHYSAYIRDCHREGNWTAPPAECSSKASNGTDFAEALKTVCFLQNRPGQLLVKEGSPLNVLLSIMSTCSEGTSSPHKQISSRVMQVRISRAFRHTISTSRYAQVSQLSGLVKRNIGKNWNQLYQKVHGSLLDFAKKHSDFFQVSGTEISLRDMRYQAVPEEQFVGEWRRLQGETARGAEETKDAMVQSPSDDAMVEADAVLAAQLAQEENGVGGVDCASSQAANAGQWQTSGKKKKNTSRKQRNKLNAKAAAAGATPSQSTKEGAKSPHKTQGAPDEVLPSTHVVAVSEPTKAGVGCDSSLPKTEGEDPFVQAENDQVEMLAQQLLNNYHGPFFCFNDSEVRPVYVTELANAFEGRSSAYLLVYRQTGAGSQCVGEEDSRLQVTAPAILDDAAVLSTPPPALWLDQVLSRNAELQQKRHEYVNYMHSVKLTIYFPIHFTSSWPCLTLISPDDLLAMGAVEPSLASGLEVECDISKGVKMLREDIIAKALSALASADLSTVLGLPNKGSVGGDDINISKLQALSHIPNKSKSAPLYFAYPALASSDLVGDTLSHNSAIVLWSTPHLPNLSGDMEFLDVAPKSLTVTYKAEPAGVITSKDVYMPQSLPLSDLCRLVTETLQLDLSQVQIHAMQERRIIYQTKNQGGKTTEWFATPLWKSNMLTKSFALQSQRYGQMEWREVLVENVGMSRPSASGLASKEVLRRNRLRSIRVELDVGSSTITRLRKDYGKGGALYPGDSGEEGIKESTANAEDEEQTSDDLSSCTAKVRECHFAQHFPCVSFTNHAFHSWILIRVLPCGT